VLFPTAHKCDPTLTALDPSLVICTCRLPRPCDAAGAFRSFTEALSWSRAAPQQPVVFKIPSYSHSNRRPANIPLHTLSSSARPRAQDSAYLIDDRDKDSVRSSFDTPSSESDLSLWSDTGDLVDQLADQEDPLRIRLRGSLEDSNPPGHRRQPKRARFQSQEGPNEKAPGGITKEDIEIPDIGPRTISKAERILAAIMAPNDRPSRIHGLHGKKLMFV
jgi:hypothetical protein